MREVSNHVFSDSAQVKEIDEGNLATVDILGVTREISLDLTPQAEVGAMCSCTRVSPSKWSMNSSPKKRSIW